MKPSKQELTHLINATYNKLPEDYRNNLHDVTIKIIRENISTLLRENEYNVNSAYSKLKIQQNIK